MCIRDSGYLLTALITALLSKVLGRKFWALCVAMVVGLSLIHISVRQT